MRTLLVALSLSACSLLAAAPPDAVRITARSRAVEPGELVILTLVTPTPSAAPHVRAFDRDVPAYRIDDHTWQALVGIDLDVAPGRYPVAAIAGAGPSAPRGSYDLVVKPHVFDTRTLTVDDAFVNPPDSVAARIQDDTARLAKIWAASAPTRLWSGPFTRPVPDEANSAFGKRSVFNGQPKSPHGGADFLSPSGRPVKAPNHGTVVLARDLYYTGNTVIIDHGLGLFSLFAHFSAIDVHEGDTVTTGQIIGKVGATGRVTGPHLHWAVRVGGARVDPLSLLALLGGEALGRGH